MRNANWLPGPTTTAAATGSAAAAAATDVLPLLSCDTRCGIAWCNNYCCNCCCCLTDAVAKAAIVIAPTTAAMANSCAIAVAAHANHVVDDCTAVSWLSESCKPGCAVHTELQQASGGCNAVQSASTLQDAMQHVP